VSAAGAGAPQDFQPVLVSIAAPDGETARRLARLLVEERLAACGNIIERVRSIYRWQGKIEDQPEALLLLKTRSELFEALRKRVVELHPYEVPEIIALPLAAGHPPYLDWIDSCTHKPD